MNQNELLKENQLKLLSIAFTCNNELKLYRYSCNICHSFCTSDSITKIFINNLYDNGWRVINNSVYCPNCYQQYEALQNIKRNIIRPTKIHYYLNIAKEVCTRSTCLRRKYGAILVKNDVILATGYNGSPRGTKNCIDLGECRREKLNIPRGQCYEMCRALHAEQNCIINAKRDDMIDSDLYLYGIDVKAHNIVDNLDSCQLCKKMIINAGIKRVIFARPNNEFEIKEVNDWIDNDETLTDKFGY